MADMECQSERASDSPSDVNVTCRAYHLHAWLATLHACMSYTNKQVSSTKVSTRVTLSLKKCGVNVHGSHITQCMLTHPGHVGTNVVHFLMFIIS